MKSFTAIALALVATTSAHFTLDYPLTRGFDEDGESQGPCGSFNIPTGNTTKFPISGGPIAIGAHHPQYNLYLSFIYGNGSTQKNATVAAIQGTGLGNFCLPNVIAPSDVQSGQTAVLQVVFNGPDGSLFQCADIVFSSNTSLTNMSSICSNNTGVSATSISGTGTSMTTALTNANSSNSSTGSSSSTHSSASTITGMSTLFVAGASAILAIFL